MGRNGTVSSIRDATFSSICRENLTKFGYTSLLPATSSEWRNVPMTRTARSLFLARDKHKSRPQSYVRKYVNQVRVHRIYKTTGCDGKKKRKKENGYST